MVRFRACVEVPEGIMCSLRLSMTLLTKWSAGNWDSQLVAVGFPSGPRPLSWRDKSWSIYPFKAVSCLKESSAQEKPSYGSSNQVIYIYYIFLVGQSLFKSLFKAIQSHGLHAAERCDVLFLFLTNVCIYIYIHNYTYIQTIQYNTIQYITTQYNTIQYNTLHSLLHYITLHTHMLTYITYITLN